MYIANIGSRVFRNFLLLSRINQYNHFLLKVFGVFGDFKGFRNS